MESGESIQLREYLERRIHDLERILDQRFLNIETKFAEHDKALVKQATEYERRLEALNNEYSRASTKERDFVTTEIFDRFEKQYNIDKTEVARALSIREGLSRGADTTRNVAIAIVGLIATVIIVIITVVKV